MKVSPKLLLLSVLSAGSILSVPAFAQSVISVNFSSPSPTTLVQGAGNAAARTLGVNGSTTGTYVFGTWVHSTAGEINGASSSGIARPRIAAGSNPRAISVIFAGSNFVDGTEYTVSFDVTGDAAGDNSGRYWLAEISGYGASGYVLTNVAQGTVWTTANRPLTAGGSATVNFLHDSSDNGVLFAGENISGTSSITFDFIYSAGTDIAFAVGTYNNTYSIDNFAITAIPEPSTYAAIFGAFALIGVLLRRRRNSKKSVIIH